MKWLPHLQAGSAAPAVSDVQQASAAPLHRRLPPIDLDVLQGIAGEDTTAQRTLLRDYLDATRRDLATLHLALTSADAPALAREAHKIKGAARLVGTTELADAAEALEAVARARDLGRMHQLSPDLDTAFEKLKLFVEREFDVA